MNFETAILAIGLRGLRTALCRIEVRLGNIVDHVDEKAASSRSRPCVSAIDADDHDPPDESGGARASCPCGRGACAAFGSPHDPHVRPASLREGRHHLGVLLLQRQASLTTHS
jgi:hypothetical protein